MVHIIANFYVLINYSSHTNEDMELKTLIQIGGIGKVTEHILKDALGISTCEEILQKSSLICALFSQSAAG